jgi:hypothetical protein
MFTRDLLDSSSPEQFETWSLRTSPEKGSRVRFGLIALFGAFVLLQNSGRRLRAVTTWQDVRPWLELLRTTVGMVVGGVVMMLASGLYMAHELYTYTSPWVVVGIVGGSLVAISYPLMVGRKLLGRHRTAAENQGVVPAEVGAELAGRGLWGADLRDERRGARHRMGHDQQVELDRFDPRSAGARHDRALIGARVGGAPHTVARVEP